MLKLIEVTRSRTGWTVRRILEHLRLTRSRYYDWKRRAEDQLLEDVFPGPRSSPHAILAEEKGAVIAYALAHPRDGYRRLAWMMIDEDVAYVSPTSAYRILSNADLLYRWKRSTRVGVCTHRSLRHRTSAGTRT